jgi:hypothetical protein
MDDRTPAEGEASTKALAASQSLRQCKTFPSTRRILCICACVCMCMCVCVCVCVCVARRGQLALSAQQEKHQQYQSFALQQHVQAPLITSQTVAQSTTFLLPTTHRTIAFTTQTTTFLLPTTHRIIAFTTQTTTTRPCSSNKARAQRNAPPDTGHCDVRTEDGGPRVGIVGVDASARGVLVDAAG